VRWDPADPNLSFPWGLPAQSRWFEEATCFAGADLVAPNPRPAPLTLEAFLAAKTR
jgi:catechol 2,3-dioxygenase